MPESDPLARAAVEPIQAGMVVGLGTGRAASRAIEALAARAAAESLDVVGVPTSEASRELAESLGLKLRPLADVPRLDYLFDGADEVDPQLRMLKGRGGAMTREKIAAHAAARRVFLVDRSKLVDRLGARFPLPIEVLPSALAHVSYTLNELGLPHRARTMDGGAPYVTDNDARVLDATLPAGVGGGLLPDAVDRLLNDLPGVLGHGLFLTQADLVLVEAEPGGPVEERRRPA